MSRKISAEIRHQVLLLLKQGARSRTIATQLKVSRSWATECQRRFDRGDLSWLDPAYRSLTSLELAMQAVREYVACRSYAEAARICNISSSAVYRYVQNMSKWGTPLLSAERPSSSTKLEMKSTVRAKALLSIKKPKTLKSAERLIQEQRIVLESLLASIDKHLGGADGSEKKIVAGQNKLPLWGCGRFFGPNWLIKRCVVRAFSPPCSLGRQPYSCLRLQQRSAFARKESFRIRALQVKCRLCLYARGLRPPSETLMRSSAYHFM